MNSNDPRSTDFAYKKYSLEQLDNWVNDALNCEDLTPQDIYETITNVVDESVEYHKKYLTKSIELLSLLKGHRSFEIDTSLDDIDPSYEYTATGEKFPTTTEATKKDWIDFWEETYRPEQYTEKEMDAMCDAAADKEKCREYNLREAEYYNKRAQLDAQYADPYAKLIREAGGYEWTPEPTKEKKMTYNDMVAAGWTMTADGFWIKE